MQNRRPTDAEGIDASRYQGSINWRKVRADGKSFAFVKASQGQSYVDPTFETNVKGAKEAGVLIGAYHFLDATSVSAARLEARHFAEVLERVGGAAVLDLPPVLDYETNPAGLSKSAISSVAKAFLTDLEDLTGNRPIIYSGNSFSSNFDTSLGSYKLWVARYSTSTPYDSPAWKQWDFWQYTDSGRVDGISGPVDLNVYSGTEAELREEFAKSGGDEAMTNGEKAALQALQQQITELQALHNMPVPEWAKEAVAAAGAYNPGEPLLDVKSATSYDMYRLIVIMHRMGLFNKNGK
ncbi:glycoside hydrolase family 25 protein [Paenibacillus sp. P96]|uniref:Glycoside hydrolase family 25 protein n=1 Tax=Paenibacillus zeirhizosphaerae TaxID=2987519 RepID=A0ABT9FW74_9BACL|nr:glycoside hydrolase family 25 protein [Paenibacillus sp. P96]MDP4098976.1 glycoside hydrolase family 25 protein [Paenibacillus sp. P96]